MSQGDFAKFLGISASILSSIFKGRTNPTLSTVMAIREKIPNISYLWLIDGIGDMYVTDDKSAVGEHVAVLSDGIAASKDEVVPYQGVQTAPMGKNGLTLLIDDKEELKIPDKVGYRVKEIRVFFDDSHFETFVPDQS